MMFVTTFSTPITNKGVVREVAPVLKERIGALVAVPLAQRGRLAGVVLVLLLGHMELDVHGGLASPRKPCNGQG